MDGRGRALDNVFIERLWRSVKYECLYLHGFTTVAELERGFPPKLGAIYMRRDWGANIESIVSFQATPLRPGDYSMSDDQSVPGSGITRRMAIGATAGVITAATLSAFGQEGKGEGQSRFDMDDPLVTVDLSGLKVATQDGMKWLVDQIPPEYIRLSDLAANGFKKLIGLVPGGESTDKTDKKYILIDVEPSTTKALKANIAGDSDTINTVISIIKLGVELGVFGFSNNAFAATTEKAVLTGNMIFTTWLPPTATTAKEKFTAAYKAAKNDEIISVNFSKLLGTTPPLEQLATKSFEIDNVQPINIPKDLFNQYNVTHHTTLTDDGINYFTTILDLKKAFGFASAQRAAVRAAAASVPGKSSTSKASVSISDIATIAQVAVWILAAAPTPSAKTPAKASTVHGTIGIGISF